jgi:hypothetical protein
MKYIITESKLNAVIFRFLDSYLQESPKEENDTLMVFGRGDKNMIAYDKGDMILFVRDHLYELLRDMFSLTNTSARKVFKDYIESKGYRVKRFV